MADKIKLMDGLLSSKIAAGEVVERPASVVKELIENSIDAGAKAINIEVGEGGRRLIKVSDDGSGMSKADAVMAFSRHATSKVYKEEDLSSIRTMGFRGEALSSIASVARVTLISRDIDASYEAPGVRVQVDGGAEPLVTGDAHPRGTVVEVRDLFYNTPGRGKFMRTARTEYGRVLDIVKKIAIVNPDIKMTLYNGSASALEAGRGTLKERLLDIFGAEIVAELSEVMGDGYRERGFVVEGFVSRPTLNYSNANHIYLYVNGRPVKDRTITRAVIDGYCGTLQGAGRRYPFVVMDITMPPQEVDVNVHPAKTEVRFRDNSFIYHLVKGSVRKTVGGEGTSLPDEVFGGGLPAYDRGGGKEEKRKTPLYLVGARVGEQGSEWRSGAGKPGFSAEELEIEEKRTSGEFGFKGPVAALINPDLSEMDIVGQLWGEFLIVQRSEDFFVIDQHGAAERVRFEELRRNYFRGADISSQYLLIPERIETTPQECEAVRESMAYLKKMGFCLEPFGPSSKLGGETFLIKATPEILSGRASAALVKELGEELAGIGGSRRVEAMIEAALMRVACHSVIRGPRGLSDAEARALLRQISGVDFSGYCPHGRPVVKKFTRAEIEGVFKRT
ncbi:DNA mismatch repair protein MutL [hydrothermal vent metagenome]|uniref:DNA mismatch repair protein MutL n=1 Tax=hydrothermal vent metagenome TaxID=652676 RepID=A0A3B0VFH9_9ZZZZ